MTFKSFLSYLWQLVVKFFTKRHSRFITKGEKDNLILAQKLSNITGHAICEKCFKSRCIDDMCANCCEIAQKNVFWFMYDSTRYHYGHLTSIQCILNRFVRYLAFFPKYNYGHKNAIGYGCASSQIYQARKNFDFIVEQHFFSDLEKWAINIRRECVEQISKQDCFLVPKYKYRCYGDDFFEQYYHWSIVVERVKVKHLKY
ncbi:hypothetical protein BpHYR1_009987 [Brachionus plicatilis]|uniref:Uncharacterized protein n=1 Tax=Brachionus plicatilis TaxID=10195 RepID=A0A3M7RH46_BRAPC|nr:hypothetical protein BpHYR1_009987 [Brachionus plicatilis]